METMKEIMNKKSMNIRVIFHSSTGNTKKLALEIADTLSIKAEPLGAEPISFSEPVDLLFIGDGMYFGKANKRTRSFIDQLDPKMIKNVAIFAAYGGQAKIGTDLKELVQNKGIWVVDWSFICKGKAWLFINRNQPNKNDLSNARKYAKNVIVKVINGGGL